MKAKTKPLEITHHSAELVPITNNRTWVDFINEDSYMLFPDKHDWRKRFIHTLLDWATREDSLEITDFALGMKMRRALLYEWSDRYPDFKAAMDQARLMIGSRRRKGALVRKFDKDVVFKDMHKYDPEWHEINKYHSEMKKDEDKHNVTFNVNTGKPRVGTKEDMLTKESEL